MRLCPSAPAQLLPIPTHTGVPLSLFIYIYLIYSNYYGFYFRYSFGTNKNNLNVDLQHVQLPVVGSEFLESSHEATSLHNSGQEV